MCGYYSELSCCHHPTGVGDTTEVSIFLIGLATCTLVPFIHSPWGCQSINLMMLDLVPIRLLTIIFCLSFWESSKGNVFSGFSRETEPTGYTHTHTHTHDLLLEIGLCIMGAEVSHDQIVPGIMFIRKDWLPELATCVAVESPMPRRAHLV